MKLYLIEVYNDKTNWKIKKAKQELGLKFADMFRAGLNIYLDKIEKEGAISFSDEDYRKYLVSCSDSVSSSEKNL